MKKENKKYVRVAGDIFRFSHPLRDIEVLTPEGEWISAGHYPGTLVLEIMEASLLSKEEIAALSTEKSPEKKARVFQIVGYPKPRR